MNKQNERTVRFILGLKKNETKKIPQELIKRVNRAEQLSHNYFNYDTEIDVHALIAMVVHVEVEKPICVKPEDTAIKLQDLSRKELIRLVEKRRIGFEFNALKEELVDLLVKNNQEQKGT